MSFSVEIPDNSDEHYDYKCSECGRKIRFTPAFYKKDFKGPLRASCSRCGKKFTVEIKKTECVLPDRGPRTGRKYPPK